MSDTQQIHEAMEAARLRLEANLTESVQAVEIATLRLVRAHAELAAHHREVEFALLTMGQASAD